MTSKEKEEEDRLVETAPIQTVSNTYSSSMDTTDPIKMAHIKKVVEAMLQSVGIVQEVTGRAAGKSTVSGKSE